MTASTKLARWLPLIAYATAAGLVVFYLAQQMTLAPNHVDEAVVLEQIRLVANGQRLHFDFIDAYGPFHHLGPALFYKLAGNQIWGVRIWLLIVKLVSVALGFSIVRRLADRYSAWFSVAFMTVLLGLPWQALQIPFAFLNGLPILLAAYFFLICRPFGRARLDFGLAGMLSAVLVLLKVNVGAYLVAGGAFYLIYWLPPAKGAAPRAVGKNWFWIGQLLILATYVVVFLLHVQHRVDPLFYLYFDVPLLLAAVATLVQLRAEAKSDAPFSHRVQATAIFGGSTLGFALLFLAGFFGIGPGIDYVKELFTLLRHVTYSHPVLPLGAPGYYYGFNEYYWMQFPWLLTLSFVSFWLWARSGRGEAAFGENWVVIRSSITGLWVMAMLGTFALECEGTEVHLLSVLLPAVPSFFALLFGLRRLAEQALRRAGRPTWLPTAALSVAVPLWLSTIAYRPRLDNLSWSKGEWTILSSRPKSDNRLAHLRFRQPGHPGFREFSSHVSDHDWDVAVNAAAMFVDQLADDDEEILIVMPTQLIAFHSFTRDLGGRYRYLFYLVRMGLLDRKGFDALVPPDFVAQILRRPPRLVVASTGTMPRLLEVIPELQTIGKKYRVAGRFGVALVLQRTDDGMAQSESGREARP